MNNNQSINYCADNSQKDYKNYYNHNPIEVRINLPIEQIEKNTETSIKNKLKKIINYFL
jgi:hypothetical protein